MSPMHRNKHLKYRQNTDMKNVRYSCSRPIWRKISNLFPAKYSACQVPQ